MMVDVLGSINYLLRKRRAFFRLIIFILAVLAIITYNLSTVWKGLNLSAEVIKVKVQTVIQHYHGIYYNINGIQSGQNKDKADDTKRNKINEVTIRPPFQYKTTPKSEYKRKFKSRKWYNTNLLSLCGSGWQERYARLHDEIVSSRQRQRYLAYTCPGNRQGCCGYGNRLRAVVSLFYLAVLTDRAFLIDWQTPEPIENHLKPKRIQWNNTAPLDICTGLESRRHYWGTASADLRKAEGWNIQDSKHFRNWFIRTNLSSYLELPVEQVTTIWYFVDGGINKNPYLMRRAKELGIKPLISPGPKYALIGCAFDFLFERSRAVEALLASWREELHKTSGPIIGIHIRTGDQQFDYYATDDERSNNLKNTTRLNRFFQCARNIEETVFKLNEIQNSGLWFLATDHIKVKEFAKTKFPGKVITTNLTIQHLDILHNTTVSNNTIECNFTTGINGAALCYDLTPFNKTLFCANRTRDVPGLNNVTLMNDNTTMLNNTNIFTQGIIAMLVDHFILSECDFLILCDSSFSSAAVGLGMRSDHSFVFGDRECLDLKQAQMLRKFRFFRRKRST